jgi:uncharacterized membrane protein SirB2
MLDFAEWLQATPVSVAIQSAGWAIPLLQSIHILMIGIVLVSVVMISLRIFERARTDQAFEDVWRRFAPWMWSGLVVMALTGLVLVIAEPIRQFTSLSFWLKMALLVIGISGTVAFGRKVGAVARRAAAPDEGRAPEFSSATRSAALAAVVLWLAIIFLGRAIAYDVEVWGPLSLAAGI